MKTTVIHRAPCYKRCTSCATAALAMTHAKIPDRPIYGKAKLPAVAASSKRRHRYHSSVVTVPPTFPERKSLALHSPWPVRNTEGRLSERHVRSSRLWGREAVVLAYFGKPRLGIVCSLGARKRFHGSSR